MSKVFERLIEARGIGEDYLKPKYEDLIDPMNLPDMEKAVARTLAARDQQEKVLIYGDYDVDGVTASTAMHDALTLAGVTVAKIMLPNRFTDGYGMSHKVVDEAKKLGVSLVYTVDCGSRNHEIIDELREAGIETIVTDHHECSDNLPEAVAVVNPKRKDFSAAGSLGAGSFDAELKDLAGVGVAFKFAQALVRAGAIPNGQEKWLLDLVLIGTMCDAMRLSGENRRLTRYGMKVIEKTRRPGLKELMKLAGATRISGEAIGFQIGPRLNAAGRMDSAEISLKLLMTKNRAEAAKLAAELNTLNQERREQQDAAVAEIEKRGVSPGKVIVEVGDWHEGVLGIIAGKLTEKYRRPAFVLTKKDGVLKGSGRSFGDFNLAEALTVCNEYIISGGGHAEACGLAVEEGKIGGFSAAVNKFYEDLKLTNQEKYLSIHEDLAVEDLGELSLELIEEMKQLEPYGDGNAEPIFLLPGMEVIEAARLGSDEQHLRLVVKDPAGHSLKVMKFFAGDTDIRPGDTVDVMVTLVENEFRGLRAVEGRMV